METLEEIKDKIKSEFNHFEILIEDNEIIIEEDYEMGEDEKTMMIVSMWLEKTENLLLKNFQC